MSKTIYYTATSLDGFIADADNSLDWLFQFGAADSGSFAAFISEVGALAMGSTTYEWVLRHHVLADADRPQPWPHPQPTWVFTSRRLPVVPGAEIRFVSGDVAPVHRKMVAAAGGKNIWIVGGGDLAGQFYEAGLLDELQISVAPVTLGRGAPLLPRVIANPPLRLVSARVVGEAFVELHYVVPRKAHADSI
jgi:dihydrofolate reductase